MAPRERVLSGTRPTGRLHPGNWVGCLDCKGVLLEHLMPVLDDIRERRAEFAARPAARREILEAGSARTRRIATETLAESKAAVGIPR